MRRLALLMALIALPATAQAWNPTAGNQPTWPGALPWYLSTTSTSNSMSSSQVQGILLSAYDEWSSPSCTDFQDSFQGPTSAQAGNSNDGQTVHGFAQSWAFNWGDPNSTLGITLSQWSGSTYLQADVIFNEQEFSWVDGQPNPCYVGDQFCQQDLQSVATHEFGHSLGLGHTNANGATMLPTILPGTQSRSLASDDIAGICTLYPGTGGDDDDTVMTDDDDATQPPTADDSYEEDDTYDAATVIGCGDTIDATAIDQDWFTFTTSASGPINVNLNWSTSAVDLDLYLYDSAVQVGVSEAGNTDNEHIAVSGQAAGDYWVAVFPYSGSDDYTLQITCTGSATGDDDDTAVSDDDDTTPPPNGDDAYENNDDPSIATPIVCGDTINAYSKDQDWYAFQTTSTGSIDASLSWGDTVVDLDLYLFDQQINELQYSEEYPPVVLEQVSQPGAAPGAYVLLVTNYAGETNYLLTLSCDGAIGDDDDAIGDDDDAIGDDDDATGDDDDAIGDDDDATGDDDDASTGDDDDASGGGSRRGGCSCDAVQGGGGSMLGLAGLLLLGLRRRRSSLG